MAGSRVQSTRYRKASPAGGKLIREVLRTLKKTEIFEKLNSHILIAVSSGIDSMALAHLLIHYGRKIGEKDQFQLLHVNHGWRGQESDEDENFLRLTARRWGVKFQCVRLKTPRAGHRESLENEARIQRKEIFSRAAEKWGAKVFTAHHADDLAETLLWKLCTGQDPSQWGGILAQDGIEIRPFLGMRKSLLKTYLEQEKQPWRHDSTNDDPRFLRARMRKELLPPLEKIFPQAMEHLAALGQALQGDSTSWKKFWGQNRSYEDLGVFQAIFQSLAVRGRRSHYQLLKEKLQQGQWLGSVQLPHGWVLTAEKGERWVLSRSGDAF